MMVLRYASLDMSVLFRMMHVNACPFGAMPYESL